MVPAGCTDYDEDIIHTLKQKEQQRKTFLYQSPEKNFRKSLVGMIRSIAVKLHLSITTVHLSVYLLDMYMDNHRILPNKLDIVTLVCLLLASTVEEAGTNIPKLLDLNNFVVNKYSINDYFTIEYMVLTFLEWKLIVPTAAHFAEYYEQFAVHPSDRHRICSPKSHQTLQHFSQECIRDFLDQSLIEIKLHDYRPSMVAASCIAAMRLQFCITPRWPNRLINVTGYHFRELQACIDLLMGNCNKLAGRKRKLPESPDHGYCSGIGSFSSPEPTTTKRRLSNMRKNEQAML